MKAAPYKKFWMVIVCACIRHPVSMLKIMGRTLVTSDRDSREEFQCVTSLSESPGAFNPIGVLLAVGMGVLAGLCVLLLVLFGFVSAVWNADGQWWGRLLLTSEENREGIIGDVRDGYEDRLATAGRIWAGVWSSWMVTCSILNLALGRLVNILVGASRARRL